MKMRTRRGCTLFAPRWWRALRVVSDAASAATPPPVSPGHGGSAWGAGEGGRRAGRAARTGAPLRRGHGRLKGREARRSPCPLVGPPGTPAERVAYPAGVPAAPPRPLSIPVRFSHFSTRLLFGAFLFLLPPPPPPFLSPPRPLSPSLDLRLYTRRIRSTALHLYLGPHSQRPSGKNKDIFGFSFQFPPAMVRISDSFQCLLVNLVLRYPPSPHIGMRSLRGSVPRKMLPAPQNTAHRQECLLEFKNKICFAVCRLPCRKQTF